MYLDTSKELNKLDMTSCIMESIPDKFGLNPISRSPTLVDVYASMEGRDIELLELLINKG